MVVRWYYRFISVFYYGNLLDVYCLEKISLLLRLHKKHDFIYYHNIILYISDNTHVLPIPVMNTTHTTLKKPVVQN
jgi:hypothetical protein